MIEDFAAAVRKKHGLATLHFFEQDEGLRWIVFGHRTNAKAFQESVGSGGGATLLEALENLDARLTAGPINKPKLPWLDYTPGNVATT